MMTFLIYEGKVALALLVFYLFYRFLLKKETFHRFNRVVLVGTAVLSFLLPLCIITIRKPMEMTTIAMPMEVGSAVPMELAPLAEVPAEPWWPMVLTILFFAGVAFVLGRLLVSVLSVVRIVRQGECIREEDGCRIIVTERDIDPFSWMRYIVLSRKDWEGLHEPIITHEKAHIGYGHSLELLLVDLLSALQWFNPAMWMLRADLQELHEYEADDTVLRSGAKLKEYQYLLIRKAVSKSGYSVANSFNHSILKNRITMMSKSKSPLVRGLRVLYLLPLACLGIGLQAQTVYVPVDKDTKNPQIVVRGEGKPLFIVRTETGEERALSQEEFQALDPQWINSMEVLKDQASIDKYKEKYGEKAGEGVIIVTVKNEAYYPMPTEVNLLVVQEGEAVKYYVNGENVSLEAVGKKVSDARGDDGFTYVNIIGSPEVKSGVIQDVKNELRKVNQLKIQYVCKPDVMVQRRMDPSEMGKDVLEFMSSSKKDDIQIRLNEQNKLLYIRGKSNKDLVTLNQEDLFAIAKTDIEKNNDISFFFIIDNNSSYGAYTAAVQSVSDAFKAVREDMALAQYGKPFSQLEDAQQQELIQKCRVKIFETGK